MRSWGIGVAAFVAMMAATSAVGPATAGEFDGAWSMRLTSSSSSCGSTYKLAVTKVTIKGNAVTANGGAEGALAGNKLTLTRVSKAGNKQTYEAELKPSGEGAGGFSSHSGRPCTGEFSIRRGG